MSVCISRAPTKGPETIQRAGSTTPEINPGLFPPPSPQVVSIKESCYLQMERIRESYGGQTKHLKDLRDYSTQGLTTVKDQYLEQVRLLACPQGNKTKAIA